VTFSIVARCPRSGQLGVAVSTAVPAVGAMCPFVRAGVGAVSTQSWVNPYLALHSLDMMATGTPGPQALEAVLMRDDARHLRQAGAVDASGRDKRGRQSAALLVHSTEDYPLVDLRVDEHAYPVVELRRVYTIAKLQLLPFVEGMPKKGGAGTPAPESVVKLLALPPPQRPGGGGSAL
jgi:uncharacterized Ntn-hydrolase superfamily protein